MLRAAGLLLTVSAALSWAAEPRYARLGEFEGTVELRRNPALAWTAAARNMPLAQGFQLRTGTASRVEVEFDDGGVLRLGASTTAEISDYTRLSTGQRVTLISLDQGLAYFTGEPAARDALSLTAPGMQAMFLRGARVRLEATSEAGQIAVFEGSLRLVTPDAELDLRERQTARVNVTEHNRLQLYREIAAIDLDGWSEQRDRALAGAVSPGHASHLRAGLADLDGAGTWIESAGFGPVWKPAAAAGWVPFRKGKWLWYDGLGYTWVSQEPWGWAPYHHGRWARLEPLGWVWAPGSSAAFSPGEVYWMRTGALAGWGPLEAGENWDGTSVPRLFLAASVTFARFTAGALEINPDGSLAPKDPLRTASFSAALISPPLARVKPETPLRQAEIRFLKSPRDSSETQAAAEAAPPAVPAEAAPPAQVQNYTPQAGETVIQLPAVAPESQETYYPAAVYPGIVIINPPERGDHQHDRHAPPQPPSPPKPSPPPTPAPAPSPAAPEPRGIPRVDRNEFRRNPEPAARPPEPKREERREPAKQDPRVPRSEQSGGRGKQ